jgi:hypothetical protein
MNLSITVQKDIFVLRKLMKKILKYIYIYLNAYIKAHVLLPGKKLLEKDT